MNNVWPTFARVCPVFEDAAWRCIGQWAGVMHYRDKRP
jgi:hypothetical protein